MAFDVFGDAATRGYLRNVAGTNDMQLVKILEHESFRANVDKALGDLTKAKEITYDHILQTHKTLFSPVYPWAGEDRTKNLPDRAVTKGGKHFFADPHEIPVSVGYALRQGNDKAFMANKPGEVMGSLAYAHPFLDGNGRTILVVHTEMARRAGIQVNWQRTDKTAYLDALTRELDQPGKGHLDGYLKPFVSKLQEQHNAGETLRNLPGLGPTFQLAQPTNSPTQGRGDKVPAQAAAEAATGPAKGERQSPPESDGDKPKPRHRMR